MLKYCVRRRRDDDGLTRAYNRLDSLVDALNGNGAGVEMTTAVEEMMAPVGLYSGLDRREVMFVNRIYMEIIAKVRKEWHWVPRGYYRHIASILGTAFLSLPVGVLVFYYTMHPVSLLVGLPLGFLLGSGVGAWLDSRAMMAGRQYAMVKKF